MIDTGSTKNLYRSEIIRNWINRELLYQEAVKRGILKEDEFNRIMENSKKQLAASMLLNRYYNNEKISFQPEDLEEYYNRHQSEFKRLYDSYLLNLVEFNDEDKAIKFRTTVLESDWEKALNAFKGDTSIANIESNVLLYNYEVHPAALFRIVDNLNAGEVGIIFNSGEDNHYSVVQELQKFDKDSIPPFQMIKSLVENRYIEFKKQDLIRNYIEELYLNNEIEVRN
jgi:hypothetical protein